jgi:hypothetical protein
MAGKYITIINPGYSALFTRDLPYLAGSGESASINPFSPSDSRALVEGEWLELVASGTANKYTRGGNNVVTTPDTPDGEGTVPAFLYFMEEGRYDAQVSGQAHCIRGPGLFEFRTKLCRSAGLSINSKVSVWDWDGGGSSPGAYGCVRRALAIHSAGWSVGRVSRIYGTNDISVIYGMQ